MGYLNVPAYVDNFEHHEIKIELVAWNHSMFFGIDHGFENIGIIYRRKG